MKRVIWIILVFSLIGLMLTPAVFAGSRQFSRSWVWDDTLREMVDTSKYKKDPPYVIGFSNASVSNSWRVQLRRRSFKRKLSRSKHLIKKLYITVHRINLTNKSPISKT